MVTIAGPGGPAAILRAGYPCQPMAERDNVPRWAGKPGGLEAWHVTLTEPVTGRGFWVRAGLVAPAHGDPRGMAAFAAFHPAEPGRTFGIQEDHPGDQFTVGGQDRYLRTGGVEVGPGYLRGTVAATGTKRAGT